MRLKTFYEQGSNKYIPKNYSLKSLNCAPKIKEMTNLNDLTNLLKNLKFRATKSSFEQQLTEDIRTIKNTRTTLTFEEKTSNVLKGQYEKLVNNAITTSYKKVSKKAQDQINNQGKNILKNKEVIKRIFGKGKQKSVEKSRAQLPK